jgi:hypothetical protein
MWPAPLKPTQLSSSQTHTTKTLAQSNQTEPTQEISGMEGLHCTLQIVLLLCTRRRIVGGEIHTNRRVIVYDVRARDITDWRQIDFHTSPQGSTRTDLDHATVPPTLTLTTTARWWEEVRVSRGGGGRRRGFGRSARTSEEEAVQVMKA